MNDSSDKACPDRITLLGAWFLGALLLFSALAKFLSIGGFEVYLVQQHLAPSREWAAYAARLLLAAELFLGIACFRRAWLRRVALPLSFAMIAAFSGYLAYRFEVKYAVGCMAALLHDVLITAAYVGIGMATVIAISFLLVIPIEPVYWLLAFPAGLLIGYYANQRSDRRAGPWSRIIVNALFAGLVTAVSMALLLLLVKGITKAAYYGPDEGRVLSLSALPTAPAARIMAKIVPNETTTWSENGTDAWRKSALRRSSPVNSALSPNVVTWPLTLQKTE